MRDLLFYINIIVIFVCAFGVTTQAILHPNSNFNAQLMKNIINNAYWPIYGEIGQILDNELGDDICEKDPKNCPDTVGYVFTYISLMVYMIIANVLIVNLLIAMFR